MSHEMSSAIAIIRKRALSNELTYGFVMDCLKEFAKPRGQLTKLLRSGALIRVKQGLYVFGDLYVRGQICKELLANLIHGPSYVSLEWALGYYGLIPERVEVITSVSMKATKDYDTPLGLFSYYRSHLKRYSIGITQVEQSRYQRFLIATKEKALADLLVMRRGKVRSLKEMNEILFEDLRIDKEDLSTFDIDLVKEIYDAQPHSALKFFIAVLERSLHE